MQVETDSTKMHKRYEENCQRCGEKLKFGMTFHNIPENCEERKTYTYMEIGEGMHAECYIQHVIDSYLELKMKHL